VQQAALSWNQGARRFYLQFVAWPRWSGFWLHGSWNPLKHRPA